MSEDQQQRVGTETGSPRKIFLQAEPLQCSGRRFKVCAVTSVALHARRTALQNRGQGTAVRWESGAWVDPLGEKAHNCTAEIRNKAMEE